ncbi:MAG: hemolysin family protein [Treponema sp.]|nr:hemolysin family protein [Treponema sp.]
MDVDIGSFSAYIALFILLLLSFYFSFTETAFTAMNRIRIKTMAEKGSKKAKRTLAIYDDFGQLLSSLLMGTNITNIAFTAICTVLFINYFGDIGPTLSAIFTTVIVVIFAEVTPKILAKESPEKIALFCSPLARFFMLLFKPANVFFALWKRFLLRIFKLNANDRALSEDELLSVVDEARHSGVIDEGDKEIIRNVIEFYAQKADSILTPRIDITAISINAGTDEIANIFMDTGFSRIPVYDKSIDNIIGILHIRDFLSYVIKKDMPLEKLISPPVFVSSKIDISDLFDLLQKEKSHFAIIVDEHGGTDGIITMEDILEELVGEIYDESDKVINMFTSIGDNKHKIICSADTHDLFKYFNLSLENIEEKPSTICGWIVDNLGKIPQKGDTFRYENLIITVSKVERRRTVECIISVE